MGGKEECFFIMSRENSRARAISVADSNAIEKCPRKGSRGRARGNSFGP